MDLISRMAPSSQEGADHLGSHRAARRANIERDSPNSEDGVELVKNVSSKASSQRKPSDREGAE